MSFSEFALRMYPFWCLGLFTLASLSCSKYKSLLKFNLKSFAKFAGFMVLVSAWRIFSIRLALKHGASPMNLEVAKLIPISATLTVGWEDLCHILPLIIIKRMTKRNFWGKLVYMPCLITIMAAFASGHIYQGLIPALLLSFYIPYGVNFAEKRGLTTLMACHVIYDLMTLLAVRFALGI